MGRARARSIGMAIAAAPLVVLLAAALLVPSLGIPRSIAFAPIAIGLMIAVANGFLLVIVPRLRRAPDRQPSGFPFAASLFALVGACLAAQTPILLAIAAGSILIDPAGLFWSGVRLIRMPD